MPNSLIYADLSCLLMRSDKYDMEWRSKGSEKRAKVQKYACIKKKFFVSGGYETMKQEDSDKRRIPLLGL